MPLTKASTTMGFSPGLLHSCQYQPHKGLFHQAAAFVETLQSPLFEAFGQIRQAAILLLRVRLDHAF